MKKLLPIISFLFIFGCTGSSDFDYPYQNPKLDIEKRTDDLLSRMTLEEKFWQLFMIPGDLSDGKERYKHGIFGFQVATKGKSANEAEQLLDYSGGSMAQETAELINSIQKYFVEETRLGIPIIPFDEALHGLVRPGATAFPQAIGLAATFDTAMVAEVAHAIAMETKTRGIRQILSPVLNIARDVRWGRTEETYGEDPYLTTQMALSFISQFEQLGVITTPKHFVANVGDGGRDSYPIHFNERLMEEVYFPAYKAVFQQANAWSVMTSYNSYDGSPCTANNWLLNEKLKKEWGFDGFVISDAGATGGANVLHFTTKDYAESTEEAIENGLDVIFQTSYDHYPLFFAAFEKGMVDKQAMDEAVRRVLRAKFKLGLFEHPYVDPTEASKWNGTPTHRQIAEQAALKTFVLLKNDHQTLPLNKNIKRLALIGTDAVEGRLGGYSGPGNHTLSIRQGLDSLLSPDIRIKFEPGPGRHYERFTPIAPEYFYHIEDGREKPGLKASYFNDIDLSGNPELVRIDRNIDFGWTLFSPDQNKINYDFYSVRWTGKLIAPKTGLVNIGFYGDEGYRLFIDEELVIDRWAKRSVSRQSTPFHFNKNQTYDIRVEFFETVGNVRLKMVWDALTGSEWEKRIQSAVRAAKQSDYAIVVAGIEEGEFRDRASLRLPGKQEALIQAVSATGTPLVVVLVGGSAVVMNDWIDQTDALLNVWYPGDAGGMAVAKTLFGDSNPAGRLPITYPVDEAQLPLYYNHKPTGRGDDYLNLTGKPLFPFGYGLSYTKFEYSDLQLSADQISVGEDIRVSFNLKNTGEYDGEEVVQLYLKDLFASVARPIYELKGFKRIALSQGEERQISFTITPDKLKMLNKELEEIIEPGRFRIMIGSASNRIHLRTEFEVIQ